MKFFSILLLFTLVTFASASVALKQKAFQHVDKNIYPDITNENTIDLGRIRTQGSLGVCYAMNLAKKFEHLCRSIIDCDLGADEVSPLYLAKVKEKNLLKEIYSGGSTREVLKLLGHSINTADTPLVVVKESCLPFNQTLMTAKDELETKYGVEQGIVFLRKFFNEQQTYYKPSCNKENALLIKSHLDNLRRPVSDIEAILSALPKLSFEDFLTKLLYDKDCLERNNTLEIPLFTSQNSRVKDFANEKDFMSKISSLLDSNIAPSLNLCLEKLSGSSNCSWHSVMLSGHRQRCDSENNCHSEVQVHNTRGNRWQKVNNDGWVSAKTLLKYSLENPSNSSKHNKDLIILEWLESKDTGKVIENKYEILSGKSSVSKALDSRSKKFQGWSCTKGSEVLEITQEKHSRDEFIRGGYICDELKM